MPLKTQSAVSLREKIGKNRESGFTLIELLVVIAIIVFIASLIIVQFEKARVNARDAKRKTDIEGMRKALDLYSSDNSIYPAMASGYGPAGTNDWLFAQGLSAYLSAVPRDPKCKTGSACNYQYVVANDQQSYGLYIPFEGIAPCKFVSAGGDNSWFGSQIPLCSY